MLPVGQNQIFVNNSWREFQPYIYHEGVWRLASTNIYHQNEWKEISKVPTLFFDNGAPIDGIVWDRNFYKIPEGKTIAYTTDSSYGMHDYSSSPDAYANRSTPVFIPGSATALKVLLYHYYESGRARPIFQFGFLKNNSEIEMTDTSQGKLTSTNEVFFENTGNGYIPATFELTIDETLKNSTDYRIVINYLGSKNYNASHLYINKVWFE